MTNRFIPDFKRTLALGIEYLNVEVSEEPKTEKHFTFSLESGIFLPLYTIAMNCRESSLRRQAIELMKHATCQEGMSEGDMIAKFCEQLVDLEEAGATRRGSDLCAGDILEESRWMIVTFALGYDPHFGRLICGRYMHESTGELLIKEKVFRLVP